MKVRPAAEADADDIRSIVQRSMAASYALGPSTIETAVTEWFGDEAYSRKLDDDDYQLHVAESDDTAVGIVEAVIVGDGTGDVNWVHIDPDYRGQGAGKTLFDHAREMLLDAGVDHVRGVVLANNGDGTGFYERQGFERVGERELEIDGRTHTEYIYHEESIDRSRVVDDDGTNVYVDEASTSPGSIDPFYRAYADPELEERYGYQCGHCDSLANAMDAMGRIECDSCGNTRKPTRWDAAYL